MSAIELLEDAVASAFARAGDEQTAWALVEEGGYAHAAVLAGLPEAAAVVRTAAAFDLPMPIAETALIAAVVLSDAGLEVPDGRLTITGSEALRLEPDGGDWRLSGSAPRVPWGRSADYVIVLAGDHVACVPGGGATVDKGENLAGEPRDGLRFDSVLVPAAAVEVSRLGPAGLLLLGALARAVAIVGVLERVLELTVQYATEREQFGRPIGHFQAVQQEIAKQAAEVAAARAIVDTAVERPTPFLVGCAKVRAGEAAGVVARIAHQVHGAIGFTDEHVLHRFTTRLWAWRDEFGTEEEWAERVGQLAAEADELWPYLVEALEAEDTVG